jgi:hypothetical protein
LNEGGGLSELFSPRQLVEVLLVLFDEGCVVEESLGELLSDSTANLPNGGGEVAAKGECTLDVEVLSNYIAEGAGDIRVMVDLTEA